VRLIAAATSYSTHRRADDSLLHLLLDVRFQRIGDLAWAAGDMRSRGFLLGAPRAGPR